MLVVNAVDTVDLLHDKLALGWADELCERRNAGGWKLVAVTSVGVTGTILFAWERSA